MYHGNKFQVYIILWHQERNFKGQDSNVNSGTRLAFDETENFRRQTSRVWVLRTKQDALLLASYRYNRFANYLARENWSCHAIISRDSLPARNNFIFFLALARTPVYPLWNKNDFFFSKVVLEMTIVSKTIVPKCLVSHPVLTNP